MMQLTSGEVSRLAGFKKPWMLNHLEREKIFVADTPARGRHGKLRKYTFRDLIVLRAINRMLELGARPKRIADAILTFSSVLGIDPEADQLAEFAKSVGSFVITKDQVYFCKSHKEVIDLLKRGQLSFSFMVDVKSTLEPVVASYNEYKQNQRGSAQHRKDRLNNIAEARNL